MIGRRRGSLRGRLLLTLAVGLLVLIGVQALLSYRVTLSEVDRVFDVQMKQIASALTRAGQQMPADGLRMTQGSEDDFDLWIRQRPRATGEAGGRVGEVAGPVTRQLNGRAVRRIVVHTQTTSIEITQDIGARRELAAEVALHTMWGPALAGAGLVLALLAVVATLTSPLHRLRREVAARESSDLSPLSTTGLPSELAPVVEEMNRLMERIAVAFALQRTFVADAAHELRTPLAALTLQVDSVSLATGSAERELALRTLRTGLARAARVVDQLMLLARTDDAPEPIPALAAPVALKPLLVQLVRDRTAMTESKRQTLEIFACESTLLLAEPMQLRTLFANLLDNAVRYTPAGGSIQVHCVHAPHAWRITVHDSGPGIPEAEHALVRERFYRVAGTAGEGSGLGLAIVEGILRSSGASLELSRSSLGGLAATVVWPDMAADA